jgi:hypothetical protein
VNTVFADSSALVKLYADEPGSELVRRLTTLIVCQQARVEVPAALWRKHRMNELSADDASILVAAFEADYFGTVDDPARFFLVIGTTASILETPLSRWPRTACVHTTLYSSPAPALLRENYRMGWASPPTTTRSASPPRVRVCHSSPREMQGAPPACPHGKRAREVSARREQYRVSSSFVESRVSLVLRHPGACQRT